ncbi:MAG: glycosyltransferase family 2 protein [Candidatus Diapherotrites archaeon]|uniref:Glycosyltransferase family 2 protein n=1 Tax=Candidatus Iainarchaeum sp. TaxID=3101447 RepID=A0A8T4L7R2_9ARCH|nr:glycosyltransferase family 2 protein [Candidatus Diapherotrites archaeon]
MLSVVVSTFNRQSVYATLSALKQLQVPVEIIVVDDGSQVPVQAGGVRLYRNAENKGLSHCRNKGLELASNDFVAFIDDDALPALAWSQQLEQSLLAGADIVGGQIAPEWVVRAPWWFCSLNECLVGVNPTTRIILGCNFAVRRSFLRLHGLIFNESLGRKGQDLIAGEESELFFRARERGAKIVFNAGALVLHILGPERAVLSYLVRRVFAEGRTEGIRRRFGQHFGYFLNSLRRAFHHRRFREVGIGFLELPLYLAGGLWGKLVG